MKTEEQILITVANEKSYDSWGELMYDTHEHSQIEYTEEAMDKYAKQESIAFNTFTKRYILVDDNLYTDTKLTHYTTEGLYSLYLQSKNK